MRSRSTSTAGMRRAARCHSRLVPAMPPPMISTSAFSGRRPGYFSGGAAAAIGPGDSYETHAFDTIKGSDYLADQDVVEAFVREAPVEVIQMEHWGCPWSRNPDGSIAVRPFGGMTTWRTCFAADKTGFHMLHAVFQKSLKYPQLTRHDEAFVTKLLVEDSRCVGVTAIDLKT